MIAIAAGILFVISATVPAKLATAVEGSWQLDDSYRITFHRKGPGLTVHQEATMQLGKRVTRSEEVQYDSSDDTLGFPAIGPIHRTLLVLRFSDGALQFAFSSKVAPGKWTHGEWKTARRSPPDQPK